MKKAVYTITGVILLSLFTFTQSITIVKPNNRSTWAKNEAHTIEWRKSGEMDANVKIRLFRGSSRIKSITNSTPTRNENFRCPPNFFNDVPDGSYTIKVKTLNNNVSGNSAVFRIGPPPDNNNGDGGNNNNNSDSPQFRPPARNPRLKKPKVKLIPMSSIKIVYPRPNTDISIYGDEDGNFPGTIPIRWEKLGIGVHEEYVKITLSKYNSPFLLKTLTTKTGNNGTYYAFFKKNFKSGKYTFAIETLDNKVLAECGPVQIYNQDDYASTSVEWWLENR